MKVQRCEQIIIKKDHPKFKIIDEMCFNSKNLYNEANYVIRQKFIESGEYLNYYDMNKEFKTHENYKLTFSQPANCTLRLLDKNWRSYFKAIKDWKDHPNKYLGMPKLPKYLPKDGRFPWMIPNNQLFYDYEKGEASYEAPGGMMKGEILSKWQYKIRRGKLIYEFESDVKIDDEILKAELGSNGEVQLKNIIRTIQKLKKRGYPDFQYLLCMVGI